MFRTPSKVDQKMTSLYDLQRTAIQGCDSAAKIFQQHSKRPYFKKIDLLCDRLKQDLGVTNKAVININSHGVAWAIKDFIFVFNRIISAWVIMRDYFYSTSEGMQCVKESIDPNLAQTFMDWQEVTSKMAKSLMNSYENLHYRDQRNGNRKSSKGMDSNNSSPAAKSCRDSFKNLFDPLIAENSEQAQLGGGYLKSAVYKPLSTPERSSPPDTPNSTHDYESFKLLFNELLPNNGFMERNNRPVPLYKRSCAESTPASFSMKTSLNDKLNSLDINGLDGIQPLSCYADEEVDIKDNPMLMMISFEFLQQLYGENGAKKVIQLLNEVMSMPESISFLSPSEGKNFPHRPNFMQNDTEISMTSIIKNVQDGKYKTLHEVFIALKMIAEYAKAILLFHPHGNQQMKEIICEFVRGIESSLSRHA